MYLVYLLYGKINSNKVFEWYIKVNILSLWDLVRFFLMCMFYYMFCITFLDSYLKISSFKSCLLENNTNTKLKDQKNKGSLRLVLVKSPTQLKRLYNSLNPINLI